MSDDLVTELDFPSGSKCNTDVSGKQKGVAYPVLHNSQNDVSCTVMCC